MSIRTKTLLTICATLVALVAVLNIMSRMVLLNGFADLERRDTRKNVERVQRAFTEMLAGIDGKASDWSAWDDIYAFVRDGNEAFVASNLSDSAFSGMKLNMILVVDNNGKIMYGNAYDLKAGKIKPLPDDLKEQLSPGGLLLKHSSTTDKHSGLVMLADGPLMLVSQPIVTTAGTGPVRGSLVFARYLNSDEVKRLSGLTQLTVTACRLDKDIPLDFERAQGSLTPSNPIVVNPLSKKTIAGYTMLKDIYNRPCMMVSAQMPRDIYRQGMSVVGYLTLGLVVAGLCFACVMVIFMDRLVLRRLAIANRFAMQAMTELGLE